MIKRAFYILFIVNCSLLIVNAQQPTLEWAARNLDVNPLCMAIDSTGNIFVAGNDGQQPYGFSTLKYSPSGQLLWATRFVGGQSFVAQPVNISTDIFGNIYVDANDVTQILIKYNVNGVQEWVRRAAGLSYNMILDIDGNVTLIKGGGAIMPNSGGGAFTIRYNSNGDSLWSRYYDGNYGPNGYLGPAGLDGIYNNAIYIGGQTIANTFGGHSEMLTLSYDINGNIRWVRNYLHPGYDHSQGVNIAVFNNTNIYNLGGASIDSPHNAVVMLVKYDLNGNLIWSRTYQTQYTGGTEYNFIKTDHIGNIIIAGNDINTTTLRDFGVIKYDSSGNQLWVRTYDGYGLDDFVMGLSVDINNNIYVIGNVAENYSPYFQRITMLKYDVNGNQQWLIRYPQGDTLSGAAAIIVDKNLNIYVAGQIGFGLILKYSQPIGIKPISTEVPNHFKLFQNYPNPFNNSTIIKFQIAKESQTQIKIYDITGKEIRTLVDDKLKPGTYKVEYSAENLASGVYFYELRTAQFTDTKKLILIK